MSQGDLVVVQSPCGTPYRVPGRSERAAGARVNGERRGGLEERRIRAGKGMTRHP